ncbi:DUF2637 domain-containing protein [Streptomyces sp. NPDC046915]|uniref:DUF2637 domain-containing protein n=1 Tax=Streptomyces sp. NPDC046915 TaxID=3155257 RepID=UPI0033E0E127
MRAHLARVDAVLIQAVIAAALSFAHLHDIASAAGQDGWKAWAYPISVDLLLVAAWRRLRSGDAKAAGWSWFVIALTASLGANVATAGLLDVHQAPAWLRILVAGWPAIAFLGGTLLAHTAPKPHATTNAGVIKDEAAVEAVPERPAQPAVPVPAALVAHARKVADDHHTRTGFPIDTPTLRARLGVPAPMAEAIAAQLT